MEDALASLKEELNRVKSELEASRESAESAAAEFTATRQNLENEAQDITKNAAELAKVVEELKTERELVAQELEKVNKSASEEVTQLANQKLELEKERSNLVEAIAIKDKDIEELKGALQSNNRSEEVENLRQKVSELETSLNDRKIQDDNSRIALEAEIVKLQSELAGSLAHIEVTKAEHENAVNSWKTQITDHILVSTEKDAQIVKLGEDITRMQSEFQDGAAQLDASKVEREQALLVAAQQMEKANGQFTETLAQKDAEISNINPYIFFIFDVTVDS